MKNYKKTSTGILGVLLVSILLAGCSDFFTPPGATGADAVGNVASIPGNSVAASGSPDFSDYVNWIAPTPNR
jgi:hypothetical protein